MGNTWSRDLASSACHATWQYHTRLAQYTFSNFLWQSAVRCLQVLAAGFVLLIEGGQWFWPPVRVGFVRDLPGTPYQLPGGEELCSFGPKWPNFLHSIGPYDIIWIKYDKVPCLAAMAACQSVRFVSMCFVIITVWVWSKPKKNKAGSKRFDRFECFCPLAMGSGYVWTSRHWLQACFVFWCHW